MIAIRLAHFRDRRDEWGLAGVMLGWGLILLLPGPSFVYPSYRLMASIAPENVWGTIYTVIGAARLLVLYVNGSRAETPVLRQWGAGAGMLLWAFLTIGSFGVDVHLPTTMLYAGAFVLEGVSLSAAAGDAVSVKRARGSDAVG